MDVGEITENGTSFDIASVGETDAVLVRSDTGGILKTRWMYKDEQNQLIVHEKTLQTPNIVPKGSYISISQVPGYGQQELGSFPSNKTTARTCTDINFDDLSSFHSKTITVDGVQFVAALVPVKLM